MLPLLHQEGEMLDVVYIVVTLAFFALMLAYVRGCGKLGDEGTGEADRP